MSDAALRLDALEVAPGAEAASGQRLGTVRAALDETAFGLRIDRLIAAHRRAADRAGERGHSPSRASRRWRPRGEASTVSSAPPDAIRASRCVFSISAGQKLCRDLERAIEFDQSHLFQEDLRGGIRARLAASLTACLIGDYQVLHRRAPRRIRPTTSPRCGSCRGSLPPPLRRCSSASPRRCSVSTALLNCHCRATASVFRLPEYQRWSAFQEGEDARFVGLVLPRVLGAAGLPG